ncbi:MAG: ABC transporter substrate-binding protein [Actinomycetaceae bacterium]|nr:ABC transporter substrate-binding protein [Actinomycetaceae bacterium]
MINAQKQRKRRLALLPLVAALTALTLTACGSNPGESTSTATPSGASTQNQAVVEQVRALVPKTMAFGAPMVGFGKEGNLAGLAGDIAVDNWDGVEQLHAALLGGEAQVAATPANVAANMYNKGVDIRLVAQVVWGMLYVLGPEDATEGDWQALRGEKVIVVLPESLPDLVFSYLLAENGLNRDSDIEVIPAQDGRQAISLLSKGEASWVVIPEHAATMAQMKLKKSGVNLKRVLDLQQEWGKVTGGQARFPMASLVMPGELVDAHPELVEAVRAEVSASVEKANSGDADTIAAIAKQYKVPEKLVEQVIPRLKLEVVPGAQSRTEYEDFLTRIGKANAKVYGGKLPDEKFYVE